MTMDRLKVYGKNSSLHGLKYVADEENRLEVRILWAIMFILNFGFMLLVFNASYKSFQENAVSFVTETTYLDWNTTFPAITVCPIAGSEPDWDGNEEAEDTKLFVADVIYYTGSCYSCDQECERCRMLNFTQLVLKYRKKCKDILTTCRWGNVEFECCERLLPLETEYGFCYSFNSIHTENGNYENLHRVNRKTDQGVLTINTKEDVRVYFHAPEDVPFINSDPDQRRDVMLGESLNISINVLEISNDENVKNVPIWKRGCKFPWENEGLRVHKYYSYSTCVVECHAEHHIRLCNCTHHLMPYYNKIRYCDMDGLKCLTDNFDIVNRLHAKNFEKPGIVCDCLPSCVEPEYTVVVDTKDQDSGESELKINVHSLPTSRFTRIVLRTTLDLVVGGAAGLFIGASLLSIIEIFYLLYSDSPDEKMRKKKTVKQKW